MAQEFNQAVLDTVGTIGAVALGSVLAVLITHRLTDDRERSSGKKNRKREFLVFMRGWRKDAEGIVLQYDAIYHFPKWYLEAIPGFCGVAETIRGDFTGERRKKFEALTVTISDSNWRTKGNPDEYKKWLKIVDELIVFVDANKN